MPRTRPCPPVHSEHGRRPTPELAPRAHSPGQGGPPLPLRLCLLQRLSAQPGASLTSREPCLPVSWPWLCPWRLCDLG